MNWRERYTKIHVGDEVRIIKPNPGDCSQHCDCLGKGVIGKVKETGCSHEFGTYLIYRTAQGDRCYFPRECLEKV